jgi:hypothetical protein
MELAQPARGAVHWSTSANKTASSMPIRYQSRLAGDWLTIRSTRLNASALGSSSWPLRFPPAFGILAFVFDSKRKRQGLVSRHRVRRHPEREAPTTVAVQTEQPATQPATQSTANGTATGNPAFVGLGLATHQQFMAWRASVLRQRDPGPMP